MRNPYLTPAMERVLRQLVADGPDGDIVGERGEWWCGYERTTRATVRKLLGLCLVKVDGENHGDGKFQRFVVSQDGEDALRDPKFVPRIVAALRKKVRDG